MTTRIIGTGSYLPKEILTNDYLSEIVDTNNEWITERTGIRERRIATTDTTSSMASAAALSALKDSKMLSEEIDLIIVATFTPNSSMPSIACQVQGDICATNAVCFDLNAACSGFIFALTTAHAFISSGIYENALIIGSETLSRSLDWTDRGTCVLFGDGAGAVVLSKDTTGFIGSLLGSDGKKGDVLTYPNQMTNNLFDRKVKENAYLQMDGQEVFKFAVRKVPENITNLLENHHINIEEIDCFILHQANKRIIQSVAKRLKVNEGKFPINLDYYGNTSAASIPILLDDLNKSGQLKRNDTLVLSGFGGGLTWGSCLLTW